MRGFGHALHRLPAARALLAGAAILAGASAPVARAAEVEEVAFAQPRAVPAPSDGASASLPRPLSPADEAQVRRVFALQATGDLAGAESALGLLRDGLLTGHLLADRLLARGAAPGTDLLLDWMRRYADHPDAPAVQAALAAKLPRGAAVPPIPALAGLPYDTEHGVPALARNPVLDRTVHERAGTGRAELALRLLARTRGLDALYGSQLRGEVARILFVGGHDAEAAQLGEDAFRQSGGRLALPAFVAGLAAWRQDRPDAARALFEGAARAALATPAQRAAAAFWAARTYATAGGGAGKDPASWEAWMRRAAREGQVFYAMLAQRALGETGRRGKPARDLAGEAELETVAAQPGGARAFGLLQVGQRGRAEAELRLLWQRSRGEPALARSVLLAARLAGMRDLADELSPRDAAPPAKPQPGRLDGPQLRPAGGFRADPALVYALTRLESNFDSDVVSPAGARGLMQIMPGTASYLAGDGAKGADMAALLLDPAVNLDYGQRYLAHLSKLDLVGGDLIRLLASYNSGPGSFGRWAAQVRHGGDPLLFLESIPNGQTRAYVPRALTWSWIYAARLGRPAPSLDELAAGRWPRYVPLPARAEGSSRLH